ncbi:hypothetical protein K1719_045894 [Acacia pycnantha]|nr:hypothetical protein K1719_045894 [Acacia pycnantha]
MESSLFVMMQRFFNFAGGGWCFFDNPFVKPMPLSKVLDASKEKMFASLVSDSSAKSLSRYTKMVDDIIRSQAEKLQRANELTRIRLKEMELPVSILALEGNLAY